MGEKYKSWTGAALRRAVRTAAQAALGVLGTSALFTEVNWAVVGGSALLAAIASLLTSTAGLPEVESGK